MVQLATKRLLSGSTNGRRIKVAATATAGTVIHTAVSGTDDLDEIWINAYNNNATAVDLTIEFGGVASPDDIVQQTIASKSGISYVIAGELLQNGLVVRAFASVANVVTIGGFVNRLEA